MNRILNSISFATLVAALGQWGLMHETLLNFGIFTLLGLPGFGFAVLLGLEGHPGHSSLAPFAEFVSNAFLYFIICYIAIHFFRKLRKRWAPTDEIERRVYDHL
jgi:hypothetical protein